MAASPAVFPGFPASRLPGLPGFLARPLGGLFFGSLGDRKGRKFVLLATVTLMGVATTLIGALPFVGIFAGLTLATLTFKILQSSMSPAELLAWGWRVPFLASLVLIAMAIWIRLRLKESPVFEQLERGHAVTGAPMRSAPARAAPTRATAIRSSRAAERESIGVRAIIEPASPRAGFAAESGGMHGWAADFRRTRSAPA